MTKELELKKAIEVLEYHQKWRLGELDEMIYTSRQITESLDILLRNVKNNINIESNKSKYVSFGKYAKSYASNKKVDLAFDSWIKKIEEND